MQYTLRWYKAEGRNSIFLCLLGGAWRRESYLGRFPVAKELGEAAAAATLSKLEMR